MNREGTKRCLVLYGSEIWAILCVIPKKMNSMNSNMNSNMHSDTKFFFFVKIYMVE